VLSFGDINGAVREKEGRRCYRCRRCNDGRFDMQYVGMNGDGQLRRDTWATKTGKVSVAGMQVQGKHSHSA
jgi:hypothetical protein